MQGTALGIKESVYTWMSVCEGVCVCVPGCVRMHLEWIKGQREGFLPKMQSLLDLPINSVCLANLL